MMKRFMNKVARGSTNSCWEWEAGKDEDGYGKFWMNGRSHPAHRIAYFLFKKVDPGDSLVCHTCDNPGCVNPRHLFLGTHQDNHDDRGRKGRTARGERSGVAKLSALALNLIREEYVDTDISQTKLAVKYGVSTSSIQQILRGKTRVSDLTTPGDVVTRIDKKRKFMINRHGPDRANMTKIK